MTSANEILCCPLSSIDNELLAAYHGLLSADELQRLSRYRSEAAAREFIVGRALLRTALAQRLGCSAESLQFAHNDDGKPFLISPSDSRCHFNLSHAGEWIALLVSDIGPAGLDIETHNRRNDLAAIAQRFFSAAENSALANATAAQWRQTFFAIWTLKEAHAKALGCGLSKILSCSSIVPDWVESSIDFTLTGQARSEMPLSGWLYSLAEDMSMAAVIIGTGATTGPECRLVTPWRHTEVLPVKALLRGAWAPEGMCAR